MSPENLPDIGRAEGWRYCLPHEPPQVGVHIREDGMHPTVAPELQRADALYLKNAHAFRIQVVNYLKDSQTTGLYQIKHLVGPRRLRQLPRAFVVTQDFADRHWIRNNDHKVAKDSEPVVHVNSCFGRMLRMQVARQLGIRASRT